MARRSSGRRSPQSKARRPATNRQYPRTARLNALLREIVADFVERIDDDRLGFITVTGVEVDADLNKAEVYISAFDDGDSSDEEILGVMEEYRKPLQGEIGRSARLRKTPEVVFAFDPAVRAGARIEDILSTLSPPTPEEDDDDSDSDHDDGQDGEH